MKTHYNQDSVLCPFCDKEQSDIMNGGDPGPWWNGKDDYFEVDCDTCKKKFGLDTSWSPIFETYPIESESP